jgi:hypothetical protein
MTAGIPVPGDLAARRLSQYIARRDTILQRLTSVRVVLDKAGLFEDDAPTVRALAEDRLAALAAELVEVLASNPERPVVSGGAPGSSAPLLEPVGPAYVGPEIYSCGRCGAAFGVAGQGSGSDADREVDEWFVERVRYHEAGECEVAQ